MAKAKKPLTLIERCRKHSEASRLMFGPIRALYDELVEAKDFAQAYVDEDPTHVVEGLAEAIEALTNLSGLDVGLSAQQIAGIEEAVAELANLPSTDDFQTFIDAVEMLGENLDELESQRDDPSGTDADERAYTRDQVRENLDAVAEALEALEPDTIIVPDASPESPAP